MPFCRSREFENRRSSILGQTKERWRADVQIAVLMVDGYSEFDSFIAAAILNQMKRMPY